MSVTDGQTDGRTDILLSNAALKYTARPVRIPRTGEQGECAAGHQFCSSANACDCSDEIYRAQTDVKKCPMIATLLLGIKCS